MKLTWIAIPLAIAAGYAWGQTGAVAPQRFQVASIRRCRDNEPAVTRARGATATASSRLDLNCLTVRDLVTTAYVAYADGRIHPPPLTPVEGGPAWIDSTRYTIAAEADSASTGAMMRGPMLQALLEDRFQLRVRREAREVAAYALTVAKGGPKLTPSQAGSCLDIGVVTPLTTAPPPPPARGERPVVCGLSRPGAKKDPPNVTIEVPGVTLDYFARTFLGIAFGDRPVVNKTGIDGLFDIRLEFMPGESTPGPTADSQPRDFAVAASGPSIFTAVQQQLGLKLEATKAPREFVIIDRVERPSDN